MFSIKWAIWDLSYYIRIHVYLYIERGYHLIISTRLTHCLLGDVAVIIKVCFSNSLHRMVDCALAVKLLSCEYHRTSLKIIGALIACCLTLPSHYLSQCTGHYVSLGPKVLRFTRRSVPYAGTKITSIHASTDDRLGDMDVSWCRHQMETFSASLALCAGNSPVTRSVTQSLMFPWSASWLNGWVNNGEAGDLRCRHAHYDVIVMITKWDAPDKGESKKADASDIGFRKTKCIFEFLREQNTMLYDWIYYSLSKSSNFI